MGFQLFLPDVRLEHKKKLTNESRRRELLASEVPGNSGKHAWIRLSGGGTVFMDNQRGVSEEG